MNREYEVRSRQTLDTLHGLVNAGIKKMSVILRHSSRFFSKEPRMEPFLGLTPEGKSFALELGQALPEKPVPRLFSSMFGRCLETAYLIDKGYTRQHGIFLDHPLTQEMLAPFYIKEIETVVHMVKEKGSDRFIRQWFDHEIDPAVIENPETTATLLSRHMTDQLDQLKEHEIALCVSHDWNIFPLKEFKLGLAHETQGDVGYLEGVIFYETQGQYFITSSQAGPFPV